MITPLGRPFSRAVIDAAPPEPIPVHLIPWAKQDVRNTLEDELPKARQGLNRAHKELVDHEKDLTKLKVGGDGYAAKLIEVEFLRTMVTAGESKLEFYDGKVYNLNRRIAAS